MHLSLFGSPYVFLNSLMGNAGMHRNITSVSAILEAQADGCFLTSLEQSWRLCPFILPDNCLVGSMGLGDSSIEYFLGKGRVFKSFGLRHGALHVHCPLCYRTLTLVTIG